MDNLQPPRKAKFLDSNVGPRRKAKFLDDNVGSGKAKFTDTNVEPSGPELDRLFSSGVLQDITPEEALKIRQHRRDSRTLPKFLAGMPPALMQAGSDLVGGGVEGAKLMMSPNPLDHAKVGLGVVEGGLRGTSDLGKMATDFFKGRVLDPTRVALGGNDGEIARQRLLADRDYKEKRQGVMDGSQPSYLQDLAVVGGSYLGANPETMSKLFKPPTKFSEASSYFVDPTLAVPGGLALKGGARARQILEATQRVKQARVPNLFGASQRATQPAVEAVDKVVNVKPSFGQRAIEQTSEGLSQTSGMASKAADLVDKYRRPMQVTGGLVGAVADGPLGAIIGSKLPDAVKVVDRITSMADSASRALKAAAKADWGSAIPVYMQLSKAQGAPRWLRQLMTQRVRGVPVASVLETGLRTVKPGVKSAASGAAIGGGLMALDPNKTGEEIGGGSAVGFHLGGGGGLLGHFASRKQRMQTAVAYDKLRFLDAAIKDGTEPSIAFGADDALLDTAVVLQALFEGGFAGGKGLSVKLLGPDDPRLEGQQAAAFDSSTNTAYINVALKDTDGLLLHEALGHGLLRSHVENKQNIFQTINGLLTTEQIDAAKVNYAEAILGENADESTVNGYIGKQNAEDPYWVHEEIFAESIAHALKGQDLLAGTKVILGRPGRKSFFTNEDVKKVISGEQMQNLAFEEFQALKDFKPGIDESVERGTKLKKDMAGKHPGFVLDNEPNGTKGNDFVEQTPDGRTIPRTQPQVRKRVRSRRKEQKEFFPDTPPVEQRDKSKNVKNRRTPSGENQKTGTQLGDDWYDNTQTFSESSKNYARVIERAIELGEGVAGFYQQVIPKIRRQIRDTMGGMEVQFKDIVPYAFKVDGRYNILVQNYSLTAMNRKIVRWLDSADATNLDGTKNENYDPIFNLSRWGNNMDSFRKDVKLYLKNHAEGKAGATEIGTEKRDLINAFLIGANKKFEEKNALREKLRGKNREGIIRSYRLDRLQTIEPSELTGYSTPDHGRQVDNYSPKITEPKFLTPEQIKGQIIRDGERPKRNVPGHITRLEPETGGLRFIDGIRWTARDHKLGAAVEVKTPEFYSEPSTALFIGDDGLAGTAVTGSGDLVSVFKHPDSVSDITPILSDASMLSSTLDAFDIQGFLPNLYSAFGFKPISRARWNDAYAPPNWPYHLAGRPDVVLMAKDPNGILPDFNDFNDIRDQVPIFDDYDQAMALQQEAKAKVVESGLPDYTRYSPKLEDDSLPVLNVANEKNFPFADQIIDGQKTIETRTHTRLDKLIGAGPIKLARTGGKTRGKIIGEFEITGRVDYPTRAAFVADADKHLVGDGSKFDFDKPKYGYIIENPRRYKEPYEAKVPRGRIYDPDQPGPRYSPKVDAEKKPLTAKEIKEWAANHSSQEIAEKLSSMKLTSNKTMVSFLGKYPEYLNPVIDYIVEKRQQLVDGKLSPRDVAKAYWITAASVGADAINVSKLAETAERIGVSLDIDPMYLSEGAKGQPKIRPEEMAAWWLGTESGQRALDAIEQGVIDREAWQVGIDLRDAYGRQDFKTRQPGIPYVNKSGEQKLTTYRTGGLGELKNKGEFNMTNILPLTEAINRTKGDAKQLIPLLMKIKGVAEGKKGFIGHLLGMGDSPTIDAVEINMWLTGEGSTTYASEKMKKRVALANATGGEQKANFYNRVEKRIKKLKGLVSDGDKIPEGVAPHILHHWIWDKGKGLKTTHEGVYDAMKRFSPKVPEIDNVDSSPSVEPVVVSPEPARPLADQPENQPVKGRLSKEQSDRINELKNYYDDVTPERMKELKNDAIDSLQKRLQEIEIPEEEAKKLATEAYEHLHERTKNASQVISGIGADDMNRIAGDKKSMRKTRESVNPNWLTSAFESFENDIDLAMMKARQVAGAASAARQITPEQGESFVIGERTADTKAFGSSLRDDASSPPRVYASVVEGQKYGAAGNYNYFFEWKKDTPMVITSHHHYGVGNGLTPIHEGAQIGDKNARSFGDTANETYDTLPSGKRILKTHLLVSNKGATTARAHQLIVSAPKSGVDGVKRAYKKDGIGGAKKELRKVMVQQLIGGTSQGKTQHYKTDSGIPPTPATQRSRTEAYVLNPDLANVKAVTIMSNATGKELSALKTKIRQAFRNNSNAKVPPIKVISKESGHSDNKGRKAITDEYYSLTGKVRYSPKIEDNKLSIDSGPWQNIGDENNATAQTESAFRASEIEAYLNRQGAGGPIETARLADNIAGTGKPGNWNEPPSDLGARFDTIDREADTLMTWAKDTGWWVTPEDLKQLTQDASAILEGNEHVVAILPGNSQVVRRTSRNMYGGSTATVETPSGYLKQIEDYNSVVPEGIRKTFLGVSVDPQGNAIIVTSQPFIDGKKPSQAQLNAAMRKRGFEPTKSDDEFKHTITGTIIMDAAPRNVIMKNGEAFPIDVWVK